MNSSLMFTGIDEIPTNNFGVDTLEIVIKLFPLLAPRKNISDEDLTSNIDTFKTWLESTVKRPLTDSEYGCLLLGLFNYAASEPATDDRTNSINYLIKLDFLND